MVRAALFTLAVLLTSVSRAQFGMPSTSIVDTGAGMLMIPAIQKEVGVNAATSKKITDKYMSLMKDFQGAAKAGSAPSQSSMQAVMKRTNQVQKEILAMLTPAQKTRLRQIAIQQLGANALIHPEMKKELGLNDEQTRRITAIVRDGTTQMFQGMRGMKPAKDQAAALKQSTEFAKKQEEWKAKMLKESLKGLNAGQLAKWKAAQGKPFKFDMMSAARAISR